MEHFENVKKMIDNLHSEDADARLNSMRGIHVIASTIGPERTREELLPYLTDYLDSNDEVLRVFANALATMLQEVGGAAHAACLLGPLEMLCSLDEITVRDEAVNSLQTIGKMIFQADASVASSAQSELVALVQRCMKSSPQARACACSLIATVYPHVSAATKTALLQGFQALCRDEEIMVRRAACVALGKTIAPCIGPRSSELVNGLTLLSRDASDGVRLQVVTTAIALLKVVVESTSAALLALVKTLSGDGAWRVRYMTADNLGDLAASISTPDVMKTCVPMFRTLCQDAEPEIRASAVFNMAGVLAACRDTAGKRDVLVAGTRLANDQNSHVRMCLASAALKSIAHVSVDHWSATIVPTCSRLLQDTDADVRLALVSGFSTMGDTPEAKELAPKLVPVVVPLASDKNWRIREIVVLQIPYIITSLGKNAEEVLEVCIKSLTDRVATIRDAAAQSCCKLVAENGSAWARTTLFPRVNTLASNGNYLHRVTLTHLYTSVAMVAAFDRATATHSVLPTLTSLVKDPVPNVRMNVAKAALALVKNGKLTRAEGDSLLAPLKRDTDADVSDAANKKVNG